MHQQWAGQYQRSADYHVLAREGLTRNCDTLRCSKEDDGRDLLIPLQHYDSLSNKGKFCCHHANTFFFLCLHV